jgi:two-component system sporulation sensor kinase A
MSGRRKWVHLALNYLGIVPVVIHLQTSPRPLLEHYGPAFSGLLFIYLPLTLIEVRQRAELRTRYAQKPGSWTVMSVGLGGVLLLSAIPSVFCHLYPERAPFISLIPKLSPLPPALAIAYSVFRYRFMDMVLKRSLLYSTLSCLLLGLYFLGTQYGSESLLSEGKSHAVAFNFLLILILIFVFQPLKATVQTGIDRLFFARRLGAAEVLRSFSQTLTTWTDLGGLCHSFVEKITESLDLTSGAILFADGTVHGVASSPRPSLCKGKSLLFSLGGVRPKQRTRDGAEVGVKVSNCPQLFQEIAHKVPECFHALASVRLVVVEELAAGPLKSACDEARVGLVISLPSKEQRGWLLLGEKYSGGLFLSEETALIEAACGQLAMAIDNLCLIQSKLALEREMQHREKLAAIGQLAATVAHDIRNPITGAKCLLQQVEEELNGMPQGKEYIQLALEDLGRVEESISQLLTFARKEDFHFALQDVTELVGTTISRLATQVQDKGVTIRLQNSSPIWAALDEEKIRRTLLNLLENALDAMNGNGVIDVYVAARGPEVEIGVRDTGRGLALEDQAKIFEPFFTRKEKGTGLGLAIAKKIVEGHGGRIGVTSTLGEGTTFTLALPRQRPEAKAAA